MSSNFKNEDFAKSHCLCDLISFLKREGANITFIFMKVSQLQKRLGTFALNAP